MVVGEQIIVQDLGSGNFRVTVGSDANRTSHTVKVLREYHEYLTEGRISQKGLVEKSFRFLLENEPKESILPNFELSLIQDYFSKYEEEMRKSVR